MTQTQQPEALRLADKYEIEGFLQSYRFAQEQWCRQASVELRRLHARNVELEAQLSASQPSETAPLELPEPFTTLVRKKSWSTNCYEASPRCNHRDYGRMWADERVNVYTEQQVRDLLAATQAAKQGEQP